jgi:hypothetical protein
MALYRLPKTLGKKPQTQQIEVEQQGFEIVLGTIPIEAARSKKRRGPRAIGGAATAVKRVRNRRHERRVLFCVRLRDPAPAFALEAVTRW